MVLRLPRKDSIDEITALLPPLKHSKRTALKLESKFNSHRQN